MLVRGSPACAQRAELEIKKLILDSPICLTREYLVPEYACGRIIGRGGASIREISVLSNCKVVLDKKNAGISSCSREDLSVIGGLGDLRTSDTKLLQLTGSIEQIESAKV